MNILAVEYSQRKTDGKWQKWGKVVDEDNIYRYVSENGNHVTLVPTKWALINVYDYEVEFVG